MGLPISLTPAGHNPFILVRYPLYFAETRWPKRKKLSRTYFPLIAKLESPDARWFHTRFNREHLNIVLLNVYPIHRLRYGVVFMCLARFRLEANLVCSAVQTKSPSGEGGANSDLFAIFADFVIFCGCFDFRCREFCDYAIFALFCEFCEFCSCAG